MRVLVDLHSGDPQDVIAIAEFEEIKDLVVQEVCLLVSYHLYWCQYDVNQRESGEARTYGMMWRKYKRRVLLAMSSQAFAQLVSLHLHKFIAC